MLVIAESGYQRNTLQPRVKTITRRRVIDLSVFLAQRRDGVGKKMKHAGARLNGCRLRATGFDRPRFFSGDEFAKLQTGRHVRWRLPRKTHAQ